ncbi:MAG: carboxymuconolactone decarboxylase family protein [Proteobacteria bacterium]|jgi:AhpD family alkylhydroperoxidase|nr:carboxymuconolactone decarboxylase family protein [Pseudomonadota bacterium]
MSERIDVKVASPGVYAAMLGLERHVRQSGLEHALLELVRTRVSQINGCAFCLDMHTQDARAAGESEQRLYALSAWRDTPFFTPRERAALAWAEAVTNVAEGGVTDSDFAAAHEHFGDEELADLTLAIVAINGWNRLSIAFAKPAGTYRPKREHAPGH